MNEYRKNSGQRNYLLKNFIPKPRNTNWIMDHFTQVKAAEDIKCQRQNPSQVV